MFRTLARRRIAESAKFVCDSGSSETALTTTLQTCSIACLAGDAFGHCVAHLDVDLLTEAVTAPHMRQPPVRRAQLVRLVNALLALRKATAIDSSSPNNQCKIVKGDVLLFRDGGKKAITNAVNKLLVSGKGRWQSVAKLENLRKLTCSVLLAEDGLKERRSRVRGVASLKQLTGLHAYMNTDTVVPEKTRAVYGGTNMGDVLGPVGFEKWEQAWKLTPADKLLLYGDNRRAVGGRNPGDDGDSDSDDDDDDEAPAED